MLKKYFLYKENKFLKASLMYKPPPTGKLLKLKIAPC